MDKFDDFLFHGTGMYCLAAILRDNCLYEGAYWGKPGEPHGPRFTRDAEIAGGFAIYNAYYAEGGILVLDKAKLAKDYELVEYVDIVSGVARDDEKETVSITPCIENLSKYLIAILVEPHFIDAMADKEIIETAWSEGGWPRSFSENRAGIKDMMVALQHLKNSPLVNCIDLHEYIPRHGNIELPLTSTPI